MKTTNEKKTKAAKRRECKIYGTCGHEKPEIIHRKITIFGLRILKTYKIDRDK